MVLIFVILLSGFGSDSVYLDRGSSFSLFLHFIHYRHRQTFPSMSVR